MTVGWPSDEVRAELQAFTDRDLTRDEFAAWIGAPITDEEREELLGLVRWFTRRYPTPAERFAYVRRASARWRPAGRRAGHVPDPA